MKNFIKSILYRFGFVKHPCDLLIVNIDKEFKKNKKNRLTGIELFAMDGSWNTDKIFKTLENINSNNNYSLDKFMTFVEIDKKYEDCLREKYPKSDIFITDTYNFIKEHNKKYDLVSSDNPASKHGNYYQHFSLFPHVFDICNDKCMLILNVIPDLFELKMDLDIKEELKAFRNFYGTVKSKISIKDMIKTYSIHANSKRFNIVNYFYISRRTGVYFLVLVLEKEK